MESHGPGACHEIDARVSAARTRRCANAVACVLALAVGCGSVHGGDGDGDGTADGGPGGENAAPTDVELSSASVEEQAPPGTRVGLLTAVDPDASDHHSFELTADGDGQFAVQGAALVVAPGAILNYETGATVTVTVKAIDEGGLGIEKDIDVEILDLREVVNTLDGGDGSLRQAQPPAEIVLDALGNNRVFDVSPAATVTLQNLRIRGGTSTTAGAISNEGDLTVERCIFEDNLADSYGFGGAIQNQNKLVARDSIFRRNRGFNKAAIAADGDGGTLVERCTFQDNATTGNSGGAIGGGKLKVINSTFTGNSASNPASDPVGGAVAIFYSGASEIAFSTIIDNAADGLGGGVYCNVSDGAATLTIRGSIVSNNAAATGPDMSINTGCTVVADHAVVQRAAGSTVSDGEGGSVVGSPVAVGTLGDHGGLTPTLVPAAGAVSIDLVPAESCTDLAGDALGEDQRGEARPAGEGCDAGSVEQ